MRNLSLGDLSTSSLLVLLPIILFEAVTTTSGDCIHPKYGVIKDHTACLTQSEHVTEPRGVDNSTADAIVTQHNKLRASITNAADMQVMVWDDELAEIAQKWADNCKNEHESPPRRRAIPGRFRVGQNLALGYSQWSAVIQAWFDEQKDFSYGSSRNVLSDVGHFTQMVWAKSSHIGCGFATCSNYGSSGKFYVCNYGPSGNIATSWTSPYAMKGGQCSQCPGYCLTSGPNKGLCDCNGKVCYNGGTLDLTTCQCSCMQSFYMPEKSCALNCTNTADNEYCGSHFTDCSKANTADYCPHMCDYCPYAGNDYKTEGSANSAHHMYGHRGLAAVLTAGILLVILLRQ